MGAVDFHCFSAGKYMIIANERSGRLYMLLSRRKYGWLFDL